MTISVTLGLRAALMSDKNARFLSRCVTGSAIAISLRASYALI